MGAFTEGLVSIALAIVGLGIVSILVSKNANTSAVATAVAGGFSTDLLAAEAPVTGGTGISTQLGAYSTNPSFGFGT